MSASKEDLIKESEILKVEITFYKDMLDCKKVEIKLLAKIVSSLGSPEYIQQLNLTKAQAYDILQKIDKLDGNYCRCLSALENFEAIATAEGKQV